MERQPARVLEPVDVCRLLTHVAGQRQPFRNGVIVMLSFKAGLRACEIAGLTWPMVLQTNGRIGDQMHVSRHIAKGGSGRSLPIHADLKHALTLYHRSIDRPREGAVIQSERGGAMTARSIVNWFHDAYGELG